MTIHRQYHRGLLDTIDRIKKACLERRGSESFKECCDEMIRYIINDVVQGDMHLKSYLQYSDLVIAN